jgi:hypothetical protein
MLIAVGPGEVRNSNCVNGKEKRFDSAKPQWRDETFLFEAISTIPDVYINGGKLQHKSHKPRLLKK